MNKIFPDADEDDGLITRHSLNEKTAGGDDYEEFAAPFSKIEDDRDSSEIPESGISAPAGSEKFEIAETAIDADAFVEPSNAERAENDADFDSFAPAVNETMPNTESPAEPVETGGKKIASDEKKTDGGGNAVGYEIFSQSPYQSESSDETIRKSGLAYTAAIVLFASIVFTLILGWFADLLFGTSPWGKVGGIVLGSIIGFIQFFRTTSQLLKNKD